MAAKNVLVVSSIESKILTLRGQKVMLDADLAELYGVPTKVLNQAVKRNPERFPEDFMFQLTAEEVENLRSQIVTSSWGGRCYLPYVFTEHGTHDKAIAEIINAIRELMTPPDPKKKRPIGFAPWKEK